MTSEEENDYEGLNTFFVYFIQILRNSLGDLAPPSYGIWIEKAKFEKDNKYGFLMINLIWGFWLFQVVICLIVLLNFLIAIISQAYEDTINKTDQFLYLHRAALNLEA